MYDVIEVQSTNSIGLASDWSTKFRMSFTENGVEKLFESVKALVWWILFILLLALITESYSNLIIFSSQDEIVSQFHSFIIAQPMQIILDGDQEHNFSLPPEGHDVLVRLKFEEK